MSTTTDLAHFAAGLRFDRIPEAVRERAVLAIIDSIGTVFAGLNEESVRLVRELSMHEGGTGRSTVIGMGRNASAWSAALPNGAAAHALDYDSISLSVSGFIASPTLFSILALAERTGVPVNGRLLIEAFVAGWEVEAAIARGLGVLHYSKGWHSTATLGHFGAAVGCARLLNLDADGIRSALGVAASEASGLRTMIGNMTNPFHVGKAARNGVTAALLASEGFLAEPNVIEHPYGVAVAFNGKGGFDLEAMSKGLGSQWDLVDPGLVVKVYPCCGLVHSAIDAMLILREKHALTPEDVERIEVAVHALVPPTMKFDRPKTGYEAKFSTPFCVSTALTEGAVKLEHFTDERVRDPLLLDLMPRLSMSVHPDLTDPSSFLEKEFSEVRVTTRDGRQLEQRVDRIANRGSRGNPVDLALISAKFEDCVRGHPRQDAALRARDLLSNLERLDDIGQAMELLA